MSDELSLDNYNEYHGSDFEADDLIDEWKRSNALRHANDGRAGNAVLQLYKVCGDAMKQNFKECLEAMEKKWL